MVVFVIVSESEQSDEDGSDDDAGYGPIVSVYSIFVGVVDEDSAAQKC